MHFVYADLRYAILDFQLGGGNEAIQKTKKQKETYGISDFEPKNITLHLGFQL